MSSIRIFLLGALAERGPMHGHQVRLLAEEEHVALWAEISVGGVYGALKRLAAEGLITELRVEKDGAYPQRQVWDITAEGRETLGALRLQAFRDVVIRPDPFDVALSRPDPDHLDDLPPMVAARGESLKAALTQWQAHSAAIDRYLSAAERIVLQHRAARLSAEIAWHEELSAALATIIDDEKNRMRHRG